MGYKFLYLYWNNEAIIIIFKKMGVFSKVKADNTEIYGYFTILKLILKQENN